LHYPESISRYGGAAQSAWLEIPDAALSNRAQAQMSHRRQQGYR
jgi:hypothetical protein